MHELYSHIKSCRKVTCDLPTRPKYLITFQVGDDIEQSIDADQVKATKIALARIDELLSQLREQEKQEQLTEERLAQARTNVLTFPARHSVNRGLPV